MKAPKISRIFPTRESRGTSTVIGIVEVVTRSSVPTWLTLTFIHVHRALCTRPARGTGTVVGVQLVPTGAPISTRLGGTFIVIDRAVFTCPSWSTVTRIIIDLKQKVPGRSIRLQYILYVNVFYFRKNKHHFKSLISAKKLILK